MKAENMKKSTLETINNFAKKASTVSNIALFITGVSTIALLKATQTTPSLENASLVNSSIAALAFGALAITSKMAAMVTNHFVEDRRIHGQCAPSVQ
jgi:hypothetical protein